MQGYVDDTTIIGNVQDPDWLVTVADCYQDLATAGFVRDQHSCFGGICCEFLLVETNIYLHTQREQQNFREAVFLNFAVYQNSLDIFPLSLFSCHLCLMVLVVHL